MTNKGIAAQAGKQCGVELSGYWAQGGGVSASLAKSTGLSGVASAAYQAEVGDIHSIGQGRVVPLDLCEHCVAEWDEGFDLALGVRGVAGILAGAP